MHIPLDPVTKQSKGLAYVLFVKATSALSAFETLDRTSFQGRLLHILPAVNRKGKTEEGDGGRKKTLKEEREVMKKAGAGKEFNWAMLYMNVRTFNSKIYFLFIYSDYCFTALASVSPLLSLLKKERCSGFICSRSHEHFQGRHT